MVLYKEIEVNELKFKGIYVSVWFDKNFCFYCKKRPNTVSEKSPIYYFMHKNIMDVKELLEKKEITSEEYEQFKKDLEQAMKDWEESQGKLEQLQE